MPQNTVSNVSNVSLNPNASNTGGINWVSGLNGASAWKMYPNTMDVLMDNINENIYYIKTSDNIGRTALRAFTYNEIKLDEVPIKDPNMPQQSVPQNVVTKDDFEAFKSEILAVIKNNNIKPKQKYNRRDDYDERT